MDASELEGDAKLYKASAELLSELQAKLPQLVTKPGESSGSKSVRQWVISTKIYEITDRLLDRFQEWPQLLDPYLARLMQTLVEAYLTYCVKFPETYLQQHENHNQVSPLPRAIARVIAAFCKVRGQKVIVRLLSNEPKYIEPLLTSFYLWTDRTDHASTQASSMVWEEQYLMLLWLSHLMLAPFQLSSISALQIHQQGRRYDKLMHDLPDIAQNLLRLALNYLQVPSKAREAAVALGVRLCLRGDMQEKGLPGRMVAWTIDQLCKPVHNADSTGYDHIGLLSLLFGLSNTASDSEAAPFLERVFRTTHSLTTSHEPRDLQIRDSAPARKLMVKILRSTMLHAISLSARSTLPGIDLETMLEDTIQTLLEYLADRDTPVRQAASKALSMIALKLDADLAAEISEAVLGCLDENMLLENTSTGELIVATSVLKEESVNYKKNVNAVNPLQWHGAMLTLGHLLFRRALPVSQLPSVIEALLVGLEFEQRSNVGTSIGVGVRDAACFGIWSLARKYSTTELIDVPMSISMLTINQQITRVTSKNVIQLIATHLVVAACLDPSGNLRRGSSAALQELIGRHPDVIIQGIPVVQVVDYNGVARRSRAITEVAVDASKLDLEYHNALLYALLQWRGARATDADSRRQTSTAVTQLLVLATPEDRTAFLISLLAQIGSLKSSNIGSNAAARHGLLLCLASVLDSLPTLQANHALETLKLISPKLCNTSSLTGEVDGRATADVENVLESVARVVAATAKSLSMFAQTKDFELESEIGNLWIVPMLSILDRCTLASDKEFVTNAAAEANMDLFKILDEKAAIKVLSSWLDQTRQRKVDYISKGRIVSLGRMFELVAANETLASFRSSITSYLCEMVRDTSTIETKVNAMGSINVILSSGSVMTEPELQQVTETILVGLSDYTVDQRGDIGSLLRFQSVETAQTFLEKDIQSSQSRPIRQLVVRLAAERLVKVRFRAWVCLETFWADLGLAPITTQFIHQADVSSTIYFKTLTQLLSLPSFQEHLVTGLISSTTAGTDEISRACLEAMIAQMLEYDTDTRRGVLISMLKFLCFRLNALSTQDDRELVPTIDFLAFVLEHLAPHTTPSAINETVADDLWITSQKVHSPSSSIARLEALIRLYSSMLHSPGLRIRTLDRLTRMLLHKWPKIRTSAAEYVYFSESTLSIVYWDWNRPVAECKPMVVQLRKELDVAGADARASVRVT